MSNRRDRFARPAEGDRYMGRCFHCDRSVGDHDQTVCDWVPVPERGQWRLPRKSGDGLEAAMLHVGHLATLGSETSSRIMWEQECPPGCSLLMQTSVDFERTWQDATNGDPVSGFDDLDEPAEIRSRIIMRGSGALIRHLEVTVTRDVTADV